MPGTRRAVLALLIIAAALLAPLSANAATITNGNFETGNLTGWQLQNAGSGSWFAYTGTSSPLSANTIPAPPQGTFGAISDQEDMSSQILYQDVALEPGYTHQLSLIAYYTSFAAMSVPTPDTLDHAVAGNQQYRIDVMKPNAPIASVNPTDILLTIFRTKTGDPGVLPPTSMSANLTPFAGQTVRLRFADVAQLNFLHAGTDAISLVSTPPFNAFSFGKLKRNENNGTATLAVKVPGAGKLVLTGKGVKKQRVGGGAVASKKVAAAGTVKLLVKAKGKAKDKLTDTGTAKVKVKVTFTPTFGTPKIHTKRIKLIKTD